MIIEIHGADFRNKGGELMLRTALNGIKNRLPEAKFVVDPLVGSFEERSELGLLQYFPPRGWMGSSRFKYLFPLQKTVSRFIKNIPVLKKICRTYGFIILDDVDAIIDVSGFAFTSQWGPKPCLDFASLTKYYRKHNKPVIMLPQAFGPFESQDIKKGMAEIINNSTLIYARDQVSYNYLGEIDDISTQNIEIAPDITLFYPPKNNDFKDPDFNQESLIIPNVRILDQGLELWGGKYLEILHDIIDYLKEKGGKPALLIHDSNGSDLKIAKKIRDGLKDKPVVYNLSDPLEIKNKIAAAPFIVTSRYHGAVAAFSQAVPSLCMGWSHKYNELYESFGLNRFIMSPENNFVTITDRLDQMSDVKVNKQIRKRIIGFLETSKKENKKMWKKVIKELS